jgi:ribulose 1,5-bisphosphate synthetase/thiazole synthase
MVNLQVKSFIEDKSARAASKRKKEKKKDREKMGKVIVVGAGPAGLTAALHLQVMPCCPVHICSSPLCRKAGNTRDD